MNDDLSEQKKNLRAAMRKRRVAAGARNPGAGLALRDTFLAAAPSFIVRACIATYIARGGEMDPLPLEEALDTQGCLFGLPCVEGAGQALVFRAYRQGDALRLGAHAIPEPLPAQKVVTPDVLFVPLLAFDRKGRRLGQGGGFYDRSLAFLRAKKKIVAIGLAFAAQETEEVPAGPNDQRLDMIVTERGVTIPVS